MGPKRPSTQKKGAPATPRAQPNKNTTSTTSKKPDIPDSTHALFQKTLNIFKHAYPERFDEELQDQIQQVKKHLFDRDFEAAFGQAELLQAYCLRWSPSRALAYLRELRQLGLDDEIRECSLQDKRFNVLCIGGGAGAELVAFGAFLSTLQETSQVKLDVCLLDIANWLQVSQDLHHSIVTPPKLSKYAAAHVVAANKALLQEGGLTYTFKQQDVMDLSADQLRETVSEINLVTILFTLNELYSTSLPKANKFLLTLRTSMPLSSRLLVIDSAGSYATVSLNGSEKKYPMQWLLDYNLLENAGKADDTDIVWTKLRGDDGVWFRLPTGLKYPIELEDMRYQIHIYERTS
jgi:25S rRNA (uracil2843-N3)-methyltransferase